jgi:hypothetical protein
MAEAGGKALPSAFRRAIFRCTVEWAQGGQVPAGNGMSAHVRALALIMLAGFVPATGRAQNLDEGKSLPQLFAAGCAACHQSPRGLGRQMGAAPLATFLRQHYTTSREQAAALASYVASFAQEPPGPRPSQVRGGPRQEAEEPASRRRPLQEEVKPPSGQPAGTRRRTPTEEGRADQPPNAPTVSRQPKETRQPPRPRQPAAAAVHIERAVPSDEPQKSEPGAAERQQGTGPTPATGNAAATEPSTARTDDIAD